jgi:NAD(P)-dependent dehydrogenase (short-subunit alcohol dehydrogenase family)
MISSPVSDLICPTYRLPSAESKAISEGLKQAVKVQKGRMDTLFANGIRQFAPLGRISGEHFDKLFSINVRGLFTVHPSDFSGWWSYHLECFD